MRLVVIATLCLWQGHIFSSKFYKKFYFQTSTFPGPLSIAPNSSPLPTGLQYCLVVCLVVLRTEKFRTAYIFVWLNFFYCLNLCVINLLKLKLHWDNYFFLLCFVENVSTVCVNVPIIKIIIQRTWHGSLPLTVSRNQLRNFRFSISKTSFYTLPTLL